MARIEDQRAIGLKIARVRNDMDLSQERFSEVLGVSRNTMGSIERGETPPSLAALTNLFEYTSLTPNQLFLTEETQTAEGRFAQIIAGLEPNEVEEVLHCVGYMTTGIVAMRKASE